MLMVRSLILAFVVIALGGCSSLGMRRPIADGDHAMFKKVGVASLLGPNFHAEHIGITVFNNVDYDAPVADWEIDKVLADQAVELLRSTNRYDVARLDLAGMSADRLLADNHKALYSLAAQQGIDALVVAIPGVSENFHLMHPGYGLDDRSVIVFKRQCIYAAYTLQVLQVTTQKSAGWDWGGGAPCEPGSGEQVVPFKDKFDDYSEDEKRILRDRVTAWIRKSVAISLDYLNMVKGTSTGK
jgi:hypothetical protein